MDLGSLFEIGTKEYQNISFTAESAATAQLVVWGICIGLFLAMLYTLYLRIVPGQLVRALLAKKACTPESACTLDELELSCKGLVVAALAHNATLHRLIRISRDASESTEAKTPARYYVPEENTFRAESLYGKRGNPVVQLLLALLGCVLLGVLLCKLLPVALSMLDAVL